MSLRELIDFARRNFGSLQGLPQSERSPLPPWLETRTGYHVHPIAPSDRPIIEGSPRSLTDPTGVHQWGIDVLAYYLPFHFYDSDWGIYLRASGIEYLARILKGGRLSRDDSQLLDIAKQLLLEHEHWHFLTELAATRAEVIARLADYDKYFRNLRAGRLEEALANAWTVRRSLRDAASPVQKRAENWMRRQGPGYRDFYRWRDSGRFTRGKRHASWFMIKAVGRVFTWGPVGKKTGITVHNCGHVTVFTPGSPKKWPSEFLFPGAVPGSVPVWLVWDVKIPWLRFVRPFPKFRGMVIQVHSNDHPPPHIHIQRPPGNDFTRYEWPALRPLRGDRKLPGKAVRDLNGYLEKYGEAIGRRVEAVYGSTTSRSSV